jgi:hypothetical protein
MSPRIELIIVGVVVSLVAAMSLARAVPTAGRAPLAAFAVAVFVAGAQSGFGFGEATFYPVPELPLPAGYRDQILILAMVPVAAAAVTALAAWAAGRGNHTFVAAFDGMSQKAAADSDQSGSDSMG